MDSTVIWTVVAIAVPALAGLAFALAAMAPPSFRAARICFWLSALMLASAGGLWLWSAPRNASNLAAGVLACVAASAGLIACVRWLRLRELAVTPISSTPVRHREWSVDFYGRVADVQVLSDTLARYAIAEDVTIVNRSDQPVTLSVQLGIQWAHEMLHRMVDARQLHAPQWESILLAFNFSPKQQLLFPRTIAPRETVSGHIVFDLPLEGAGVSMLASMYIGGLHEDREGTNYERECYVQFSNEAVFGERYRVDVQSIHAPQLDGSGISRPSDLAVAGHAATWIPRQ